LKKVYEITAECNSFKCKGRVFTVERSKIMKKSTGGYTYQIEKVVCPYCTMWADIINIQRIQ